MPHQYCCQCQCAVFDCNLTHAPELISVAALSFDGSVDGNFGIKSERTFRRTFENIKVQLNDGIRKDFSHSKLRSLSIC